MIRFVVIGISDNPQPFFPPEVLEVIRNGKVFSGGKRHHEIVASFLPKDAEWIDITVPLDAVFEQYSSLFLRASEQACPNVAERTLHSSLSLIVFASGDPLFFGFANTIKRKMPDAEIVLYPAFNSLQLLAHRLVMPYHDMRVVSLTGRPWPEFDKALIERVGKIGVLTDKEHTPSAIAQRMLEYGYNYYQMHVGEHLGNPALEKVTTLTLEEACQRDFGNPNCLILVATNSLSSPRYGIPDAEFTLLDGRTKMITKMPIRLLTLQALDLPKRRVLWDVGFCTGSISIEARLQFPHLHIDAFEIRPECEAIIYENARRFGAPGINVYMGDFLHSQFSARPEGTLSSESILPSQFLPDAVFIGGHGGKLKEIMAKVLTVLAPDGCIVMNSVQAPKVLTDSQQLWNEACQELGLVQEPPMRIVIDEHHPIVILKAHK